MNKNKDIFSVQYQNETSMINNRNTRDHDRVNPRYPLSEEQADSRPLNQTN